MDQAAVPRGGDDARVGAVAGGLGHPRLWLFDRVRDLLVQTGLPPDTSVVDLLLRHVEGDDPVLSAAVVAAVAAGLTLEGVAALRRAYCGEVAAGEVAALVEAAHGQAEALTARLGGGVSDLAAYGATLAEGDIALNGPAAPDASALAALIERLGAGVADVAAGEGVGVHQGGEAGDVLDDVVLGAAGEVEDADAPAALGGEEVAHGPTGVIVGSREGGASPRTPPEGPCPSGHPTKGGGPWNPFRGVRTSTGGWVQGPGPWRGAGQRPVFLALSAPLIASPPPPSIRPRNAPRRTNR